MSSSQRQQQARFVFRGGAGLPPGVRGASSGDAAAAAERQPPCGAALQFGLAGRPRAAPFASLSIGKRGGSAGGSGGAAPLFTLSMARRRGGASSDSSTGFASSGPVGSSSETGGASESENEFLTENEIEFLQR